MGIFLNVGEYINFVDSALLKFFVVLKFLNFNDFDSIFLAVYFVDGSVDLTISALPDNFVQCVVLDDSNHFNIIYILQISEKNTT